MLEEEDTLIKGTISYMDNDALTASGGNFYNTVAQQSNKANTHINRGRAINLRYEEQKTNLIHFHMTANKTPPDFTNSNVTLVDRRQVAHKNRARHLGITIDAYLTYNDHLSKTKSKINNTLGFLY